MRHAIHLLTLCGLCLITACTSAEEAHRKALIGSWQSRTMSVHVTSGNGTNHDFDVHVGPEEWVTMLRHMPVNSVYREDGTFLSDYKRADGRPLQTLEGNWTIKGDTLYLIYTKPNFDKRILHFTHEGENATVNGYIDFDGDKAFDDQFREEWVKTSTNTEL
jgi:hypothetical protein